MGISEWLSDGVSSVKKAFGLQTDTNNTVNFDKHPRSAMPTISNDEQKAAASKGASETSLSRSKVATDPKLTTVGFDRSLAFLLKREGGYSDNPYDHGGATFAGITQATYNGYLASHGGHARHVLQITSGEIRSIYQKEYWNKGGSEELLRAGFSATAQVHFDASVNSGVGGGYKSLLHTAKKFGVQGESVKEIIDGLKEKGISDEELAKAYLKERVRFYYAIANNPGQSIFLTGWLNRVDEVAKSLDPNNQMAFDMDGFIARAKANARSYVSGSSFANTSRYFGNTESFIDNFYAEDESDILAFDQVNMPQEASLMVIKENAEGLNGGSAYSDNKARGLAADNSPVKTQSKTLHSLEKMGVLTLAEVRKFARMSHNLFMNQSAVSSVSVTA